MSKDDRKNDREKDTLKYSIKYDDHTEYKVKISQTRKDNGDKDTYVETRVIVDTDKLK